MNHLFKHVRFYEEGIKKSWWTILFLCLCSLLYVQAMSQKKKEENVLKQKIFLLAKEKELALENQEVLLLQIASQEDFSSIEMSLMKKLGLVPEGQEKVIFTYKE